MCLYGDKVYSIVIMKINFISKILKFLFPPECVGCTQENFWLCPDCCQELIKQNKEPQILKTPHLKKLYIFTDYHIKPLPAILRQLKFGHSQEVINELQPLIDQALSQLKLPKKTQLIPIPLHFQRYFNRGFNQSELLAQAIAKTTSLPVNNKLLRRLKYTTPQTLTQSPSERRQNLTGAFYVEIKKNSEYINSPLLLIDDVATTLSTLESAAQALKKHGFTNVSALVLARGK